MLRPTPLTIICVFVGFFSSAASTHAAHFTSMAQTAVKFGVHEVVLIGDGKVANPFDTVVEVNFIPPSGPVNVKRVWAFYDGDNHWRARVYLSETGQWTWSSTCESDSGLHGKSGGFRCESSILRGRLLPHSKNPRQWMTDNGQWFLNLNDTAYFLLCSHDGNGEPVFDEDAKRYVIDDVAHGITSVRCFLASGKNGFAESSEQWNDWFFEEGSLNRLRLDNFQCADRRLKMLLDHHPDIAVQLILFPLEAYGRDDRFWTALTAVQRERLLRYVVARYAAFPQLLWLITNDAHYGANFPKSNAMVREVGTYLQKYDAWQHPRSTGHARRLPFYFGSDPWVTYIHIEHEHDLGARQYTPYHEFAKPVFLGEDRYEQDHGPSRDPVQMRYWQRRLFWNWLLSGGSANYGGRWWAVHPYGETGMRKSVYHKRPQVKFDAPLVGLDSVVHIRDFFESRAIDLALFEADPMMVSDLKTQGESRAPKVMRRGNLEFLIYHPNASSDGKEAAVDSATTPCLDVDLRNSPGTFAIEWFRVDDGMTSRGNDIAGGSKINLTSPWTGHDVLLRILRE